MLPEMPEEYLKGNNFHCSSVADSSLAALAELILAGHKLTCPPVQET